MERDEHHFLSMREEAGCSLMLPPSVSELRAAFMSKEFTKQVPDMFSFLFMYIAFTAGFISWRICFTFTVF